MVAGWISASEALELLGVKRQTLYANVSRGRIRSKPSGSGGRHRLYNGQDVKKLKERGVGPRAAKAVAAGTMTWGEPVLNTEIGSIVDDQLMYRSTKVQDLLEAGLEGVAALLWGPIPADAITFAEWEETASVVGGRKQAFQLLARHASSDLPTIGRGRPVLVSEAANLVGRLAHAMIGGPGGATMHERIAQTWNVKDDRPLRDCLVLLAEHELNASTFAVRVCASTGAPLSACVLAGLATLTGPRHGGAATAVASLVSAAKSEGVDLTLRRLLKEGRRPPGFGHPLYSDGDPRASALLSTFQLAQEHDQLREAVGEIFGLRPNIDFALAAMKDAMHLPDDAPFILFAIARSIGWIAHAIEQSQSETLIRPRARSILLG